MPASVKVAQEDGIEVVRDEKILEASDKGHCQMDHAISTNPGSFHAAQSQRDSVSIATLRWRGMTYVGGSCFVFRLHTKG